MRYLYTLFLSVGLSLLGQSQQSSLSSIWINGSSTAGTAVKYTAPNATPGGRYGMSTAVNSLGELYVFGGSMGSAVKADLWKWDGTNWTWVTGSATDNYVGDYGTQGVAAGSNEPPSLNRATAWFDSNDNFYVFGGFATIGQMNALWKWDGTNWTWISGSNTSGAAGVYGTKGVSDAANVPSARFSMCSWVDDMDNLFLFGGQTNTGVWQFATGRDDVWKYSTATGEWTWMAGGGLSSMDDTVNHGTLGVGAASNTPGARFGCTVFDASGNDVYLYGGQGTFGDATGAKYLEDLWKWDGTQWIWIDGSKDSEALYSHGTIGVPSSSNTPGSRIGAFSGVDPNTGDLWMVGGLYIRNNGSNGTLGDVWRYDGSNWIWEAGSQTIDYAGDYGTEDVYAASNASSGKMDWANPKLRFFGTGSFDMMGGATVFEASLVDAVWRYEQGSAEWDGQTWTIPLGLSTPAASMDVTVNPPPGSAGVVGDFECKNLILQSGGTLVLHANDTATIHGDLINNGGTIVGSGTVWFNSEGSSEISGSAVSIELAILRVGSGTSLQTNSLLTLEAGALGGYGELLGDGSVTGNVTSQTYLTPSAGGRYYHMGSPFTNATLLDLNEGSNLMVSANTAQGTTWEWDAANAEWTAANGGDLNTTATPGKGYAIFAGTNTHGTFLRSGSGTVDMTGEVSFSDVSVTLAYNDGQSSSLTFAGGSDIASTQGWNLVSNPYPSQYDWNAPTVPSGLGTAKYVFNGSTWSVYNNGVGSGNRYIAPYQAFMVQYTSDPGVAQNLVFSASKRVAGETVSLSKTKPNGVTLFVSGTLGIEDQVYVGLEPMATDGFDPSLDAHKLLNAEGIPNVYAVLNGEKYSIARVPYHSITDFPMTLVHSVHGEALTVRADASALSSNYGVILEDLKTGVMHDLETGDYHFNYDENFNGGDRFILHLDQSTIGIEEEHPTIAQAYAWNTENSIEVETQVEGVYEVEVYNVTGQLMVSAQGSGQVSLPMSGTSRGIYLVRVSQNGLTKTIKIIR